MSMSGRTTSKQICSLSAEGVRLPGCRPSCILSFANLPARCSVLGYQVPLSARTMNLSGEAPTK